MEEFIVNIKCFAASRRMAGVAFITGWIRFNSDELLEADPLVNSRGKTYCNVYVLGYVSA